MSDTSNTADFTHHGAASARIDPAHVASAKRSERTVPGDHQNVLAAAGKSGAVAAEQLQQQASELASHLQTRHRELGRWEATLHAQSAQWEDEQRAGRLWLSDRAAELDQRDTELCLRERELNQRAAELGIVGKTAESLEQQRQQLDERFRHMERREQQLAEQLEHVEQQSAWLDAARRSWEQQRRRQQKELEQACSRQDIARRSTATLDEGSDARREDCHDDSLGPHPLRLKWKSMELLETMLRQQATFLEQEQTALAQQRQAWQDRTQQQRRRLALHWQRRRQNLRNQTVALRTLQHKVDQRRDALHRTHEQLSRQQRALVETQTTLEQLWTRFREQLGPDVIQDALQVTRRQLATELSASDGQQDSQRARIEELTRTLALQQRRLKTHRDALRRWADRRQKQLREQVDLLEAREHQFEQQEIRMAESRAQWFRTWLYRQTRLQRLLENEQPS